MPLPTEFELGSGCCSIRANDRRVALDFKQPTVGNAEEDHGNFNDDDSPALHATGWTVISSAVLNGGLRTFSGAGAGSGNFGSRSGSGMHVLNYKVPADYDGITPDPKELLRKLATEEGFDPDSTVGLLTAASMSTLRTATRSAGRRDCGGGGGGGRVFVDAVVTAGISNSRTAGADADYFLFNNDDGDNGGGSPEPGTINTVVVTNASLSAAAIVEAHAVAVEAKCAACADVGIVCAKSGDLAQGTGTDATVVVCYSPRPDSDDRDNGDDGGGSKRRSAGGTDGRKRRLPVNVEHAGKHTLFAELLGQSVREATAEALLTNIRYMHGNRTLYESKRWALRLGNALRGSRPCVPPRPMMGVPWPSASVICLGLSCVVGAFALAPMLHHPTQVLLAALAWDRCLGEVPLTVHPVVIVGNLISAALRWTPEGVFSSPTLGFTCGLALLASILAASLCVSSLILMSVKNAAATVSDDDDTLVGTAAFFAAFIVEVLLLKSCLSLQLLCTIALQMAKFLDRRQIKEARELLSWLCSRDPSALNAEELAGGTLESLSENLSDGFVAPIFWFALCGPLGAVGYRVVNTLDSRVGYRDDKFEWFGKPSARLDDLINLAPARISAVLLSVAALAVPGCDAVQGLGVAWKDCSRCDSPNAGWPMGTMAGLLGVRLEKEGQYCLGSGSAACPPGSGSIRAGHHVTQIAGGLAAVLASAFLWSGG